MLSTVLPEQMQLTTGAFVDAEEVADLAALLVSPLAPNTTGAEFVVDSGFSRTSERPRTCLANARRISPSMVA